MGARWSDEQVCDFQWAAYERRDWNGWEVEVNTRERSRTVAEGLAWAIAWQGVGMGVIVVLVVLVVTCGRAL